MTTDNSLDILSQILDESKGEMTYDAWVPSQGRPITLRLMSTGQFTTISKYAVVSDNLEFQKALLALIRELHLPASGEDKIDVNQITDSDRVSVILSIILNNCPEKLVQEIPCSDESCGEVFKFETDLRSILSKVKDTPPDVTREYEVGAHHITMVLGLPVMKVLLSYMAMIKTASATKKGVEVSEEDLQKMEVEYATLIPMLMVKSLSLDGTPTEFCKLPLDERIKLLKKLPKKAFTDMVEISTSEAYNPGQLMYRKIPCPKCSKQIEYDLDVRDFFL